MPIAPFRLERYFALHEFNAPYLLCTSDCESLRLGDLLALEPDAERRFKELWLGYTESPGHPDLRNAIAKLYDSVIPDQILVHTGAEEAIFGFSHGLLSPGDEAVAVVPCYQSLVEAPRHAGAGVSFWRARPENGWIPDLNELKALLSPKTRAVFVNFPHNPTGALASLNWFKGLLALAEKHGFMVFSDEVYRLLEHDESSRLPAACDLSEQAVSLGVMSKSFGLPGLRIGWVATRNAKIFNAMARFKDYTTICNSAPSEFLARLALEHRDTILARNLELALTNKRALAAFMDRHADKLDWVPAQGGPICFPSFSDDVDVEALCEKLVNQHGLLLAPGSLFLQDGGRHFRMGFGRSNFQEALGRLEKAIAQSS